MQKISRQAADNAPAISSTSDNMDYFSDYPVQPVILERFRKSLRHDRLAHAYIFYGREGSGKEAFALELAMALNCLDEQQRPCHQCPSCRKISQLNHPDVKFVIPQAGNWDGKEIQKRLHKKALNPYARIDYPGAVSITIDSIRELKNESKYTPYEAVKKVYIVSDAEKMNRESANSFLKLLEEPPDNLLIILVTTATNALLETIRSRCRIIHFPQLTTDAALAVLARYHPVSDAERIIAGIAQGNLKEIFDSLDTDSEDKRQVVYEFLKAAARGSARDIVNSADALARRRDKNFLLDVLNLLILWIKDTINILSAGGEAQIINVDFKDEIQRFARSYAPSDFEQIILEIENSISSLKSNAHVPLLITVLGIQIHEHLRRAQA